MKIAPGESINGFATFGGKGVARACWGDES
jgi:hypothetical protein